MSSTIFRLDNTLEFARISRNAFQTAKEMHDSLPEKITDLVPQEGMNDVVKVAVQEWMKNQEELQRQAFVTVVFAAIAIESYVNNLIANNTSINFFKNYFERMDIVSKWVIAPKHIGHREIDRDSKLFEQLKTLVKNRNKIVHPKPRNVDLLKDSTKINSVEFNAFIAAENAIATLDSFSEFLGSPDGDSLKND